MCGLHNTSSVYPGAVDDRSFFSDVRLRHADILSGYHNLISNMKYQEASQYLYDNVEVADQDLDYNGAYLWNRIENKIFPLEQKCTSLEDTLIRPHYNPTKPSNGVEKKTVWISS